MTHQSATFDSYILDLRNGVNLVAMTAGFLVGSDSRACLFPDVSNAEVELRSKNIRIIRSVSPYPIPNAVFVCEPYRSAVSKNGPLLG